MEYKIVAPWGTMLSLVYVLGSEKRLFWLYGNRIQYARVHANFTACLYQTNIYSVLIRGLQ